MAFENLEADATAAKVTFTINTHTVDLLEDASADLSICDTLILAIDKFIDEIRGTAAPAGMKPDEHILKSALHAMTLLDQARDRLQEAKLKVDGSVIACVKGRQAAN